MPASPSSATSARKQPPPLPPPRFGDSHVAVTCRQTVACLQEAKEAAKIEAQAKLAAKAEVKGKKGKGGGGVYVKKEKVEKPVKVKMGWDFLKITIAK